VLARMDKRASDEDRARVGLDKGFVATVCEVLERAGREPFKVKVRDPDNGKEIELPIGRFDLDCVIVEALASRESSALLPRRLAALAAGNADPIAAQVIEARRWSPLPASYFALRCASGVSEKRLARIRKESAQGFLGDSVVTEGWVVREELGVEDLGAEFRRLPRAGTPVLLLSADLDPQTPAEDTELLRAGLPNSTHIVLQNAFHADPWVLLSPRVLEVVLAFLSGEEVADEVIELPALRFE
jgi:pimeloyl-ACP methyl ester carboxylesterase